MKTENELRIGNYVQYTKNGYIKYDTVKSIYYDDELKIYRIELNNGDFNLYNLTVKGINPIPLTRELLLKCGFSNDDDDNKNLFLCLSGESEFIEYDGREKRFYVLFADGGDGGAVKTKVKYLHQLQNLYYSISNKELKINI